MTRLGLAVAIAGLLSTVVIADIVVTNDGRRFEGEVVEDGEHYIIKTKYGRVTVPADEVSKIIEKASPSEVYREKLAELKLDEKLWNLAEEHYKLGSWCEKNRLRKEARERFMMAVALDPDHDQAHQALGHVQYLGRWVPLEEKMKAEGKVLVSGKWVSKEEAEKAKADSRQRNTPNRSATGFGGSSSSSAGSMPSGWVSCTKCGGDGILISRACFQCNGNGMCRTGAGFTICPRCKGSGKENFVCPFCGGSGRHKRGRYTLPPQGQAKIPHAGWVHCPKCNGTGFALVRDCPKCDGKGYRRGAAGCWLCNKCQGMGKQLYVCPWCGGKGIVKK